MAGTKPGNMTEAENLSQKSTTRPATDADKSIKDGTESRSRRTLPRLLREIVEFVIYDKNDIWLENGEPAEAVAPEKSDNNEEIYPHEEDMPFQFSHTDTLTGTFDAVKNSQASYKRKYRKSAEPADFSEQPEDSPAIPAPPDIRDGTVEYTVSAGAEPSIYRNEPETADAEVKLPDEPRINLYNAAKRLCIFAFAVIAGAVSAPMGMYPLGIALIAAADKYIFYIYTGLVASLIFAESNYIVIFAIYTLICGAKFYLRYSKEHSKSQMLAKSPSYTILPPAEKSKLISMLRFNDASSVIFSLLICAISCCVVGIFDIAGKSSALVYTDIVKVMLFVLISMLFTYLYSGLFEVAADNRMLSLAGVCAVIYTVVYMLAPLKFINFSIGYIISFVITLTAASSGLAQGKAGAEKIKPDESGDSEISVDEELITRFSANLVTRDGTLSDMTRGALTGLLCGIALGDTAGAVTLGIAGLISGLFFSQSALLAIIAGLISSISYSVYIAGADAVQLYIPNMVIGLTLFIPVSFLYTNLFRSSRFRDQAYDGIKSAPYAERRLLVSDLPASGLGNLSDAFSGLSNTFYSLSKKLKNPSTGEIKALVSATAESVCSDCDNKKHCDIYNTTHFTDMANGAAAYINQKKRFDRNGLTKHFAERCMNAEMLTGRINSLYVSRLDEKIRSDKTEIFALHYENIAKLLKNTLRSGREDISLKSELADKIFVRLSTMGIESENVIVMGERVKIIYVFGIKMVDYTGSIDEITAMFEKFCGVRFSEPEYILRGSFVIMKCVSVNRLKLTSVSLERAAGGEEGKPAVNGDSTATFESSGYFYGLISDGMGCGKNAAMASRMTVLLMEKLLSGGSEKDLTLEMLNNLLLSRQEECFASVDLFEADLVTGKASFIKAGAAPSFIVRNKKLFKIQSSTVPAGIIEHLNSEQTKFDLEAGDVVVMLSDGIISTFEEGAWLLGMLSEWHRLSTPKQLCSDIIETACQKNPRRDDMSVLIIKVGEEQGRAVSL